VKERSDRENLVREGFSSLVLLVVPRLRALPKLDVAGSTPVARSTFSPSKIGHLRRSAAGGVGARSALYGDFQA